MSIRLLRRLLVTMLALGGAIALNAPAASAQSRAPSHQPAPTPPSLLLITLDTTRADAIGAYQDEHSAMPAARTPVLDALARRGTMYRHAWASSPLTLPSHATLLTGLEPPASGVRDNGTDRLADDIPTLATELDARGYDTAAVIASRVLDRRFGLDRGFDHYDDRMLAERTGEYGYPERDALEVTGRALDWLNSRSGDAPFFLWVHYYDAHAPYQPPAGYGGSTRSSDSPMAAATADYRGEVAFVDAQIGRLLAALSAAEAARPEAARLLVAVVGDHGEALGDHGERSHGIFLYRSTLEVPLIVAGPGVVAGTKHDTPVAIRQLPSTLLDLLGTGRSLIPGPVLPRMTSDDVEEAPMLYAESTMPASAYGWSDLRAVTAWPWRLIVAPRPELYDLSRDPAEERNLLNEERDQARRLKHLLDAFDANHPERDRTAAEVDDEMTKSLAALGYLSGASAGSDRRSGIDPKDGIALLDEFEQAKTLQASGRVDDALTALRQLVVKSPGNVPFISHLASAQLAAGQTEAALATYRTAVELNPRLDFLHLQLAQALLQAGQFEAAEAELRLTTELNPHSAAAWLLRAERAHKNKRFAEERQLLETAVEAGTESAALLTRLAQIETTAGDDASLASATEHLRHATDIAPGWALPWLERGRLHLELGQPTAARDYLQRAAQLAPNDAHGREARRLLSGS